MTFDPNNYLVQFENLLENFRNDVKNIFKDSSYRQAGIFQEVCLKSGNVFHPDDILREINRITIDDFLIFNKLILNTFRLEW